MRAQSRPPRAVRAGRAARRPCNTPQRAKTPPLAALTARRVASVRLPPGWTAVLFDSDSFGGATAALAASAACLDGVSFNGVASSIRVSAGGRRRRPAFRAWHAFNCVCGFAFRSPPPAAKGPPSPLARLDASPKLSPPCATCIPHPRRRARRPGVLPQSPLQDAESLLPHPTPTSPHSTNRRRAGRPRVLLRRPLQDAARAAGVVAGDDAAAVPLDGRGQAAPLLRCVFLWAARALYKAGPETAAPRAATALALSLVRGARL